MQGKGQAEIIPLSRFKNAVHFTTLHIISLRNLHSPAIIIPALHGFQRYITQNLFISGYIYRVSVLWNTYEKNWWDRWILIEYAFQILVEKTTKSGNYRHLVSLQEVQGSDKILKALEYQKLLHIFNVDCLPLILCFHFLVIPFSSSKPYRLYQEKWGFSRHKKWKKQT